MLMSVQTHKTGADSGHIPGEGGIWLFIAGDLLVFSLFFVTFFVYRMDAPGLFATSQAELNQGFGIFNTLLLLTSSWVVASSLCSARLGQMAKARLKLVLAVLCGIGFFVVKMFEYAEKVSADITLNSNDFFMLYFTFTGIHLLHVVIGMGVLLLLIAHLGPDAAGEKTTAEIKVRNLESGATFWHLVDLLWIVLFAMLYLIR